MIPTKLKQFEGNFSGYGDAITLLQIATHGMFCIEVGTDITRTISYVLADHGHFEGKLFWGLDREETFDFEETSLSHLDYFEMAKWAMSMLENL